MTALNKQALTAERMEWLKKLADAEYCKNNPGHWLMSLNETNLLATLALSSVELGVSLEAAEKRIAELEGGAFNPAILDVVAERQRQKTIEGWTPKHDDKHDNNELAFAASCYAFHSAAASWDFEDDGTPYDIHPAPKNWPWSPEWWKPKNPRRDLVKAGALILAEIERLDRAAAGKGEAS